MRRAVWAAFFLALVFTLLTSCAWALERELAGVALGDDALQLLDRPGFGEPHYIGPLGTLTSVPAEQQVTVGGGGATAGLSGPTGAAFGGGGAQVTARVAVPQADTAGMYWYYRRSGGATLVLSLNQTGQVKAISLASTSAFPQGHTTRDVGIGSSYMNLISAYGYPDQVVTAGSRIELTYLDHGVRFTLDNMRVVEISIGIHLGRAVEVAPELTEPEATTPPAGLTPEELEGYL